MNKHIEEHLMFYQYMNKQYFALKCMKKELFLKKPEDLKPVPEQFCTVFFSLTEFRKNLGFKKAFCP